MRKTGRAWLLAVVCFTPFTPDPLDLIAVSAIKNFTAAQASGANEGIAVSVCSTRVCREGVARSLPARLHSRRIA